MKWPALILLMVFLLLQAGQAQALAGRGDCAPENTAACAMACCEPASCACLDEAVREKPPVTPPAPARAVLPPFVWVPAAWMAMPDSRDVLTSACHRAGPPAPCRTEKVSLAVLHGALLT